MAKADESPAGGNLDVTPGREGRPWKARIRKRKAYAGAAVLLILILAIGFWRCLPNPLFGSPYSTVLAARDGRMLGARIAADGQWRFPEAPCPKRFAQAVLAFEDVRFRWHPGVDPVAIVRALAQNLRARKVVSGASTLTMQVVRLARPGRSRSLGEKLIEIGLAFRVELAYGKDAILSLYAAHAPFGGNVVGLPAASWRYFGRGPEDLSWGEAALLAVLPNSPSLLNPGRNRDRLREKRDRLLFRLYHRGYLDSAAYRLARLEPLPDRPRPLPRLAPHLLQTLAAGNAIGEAQGKTRGEALQKGSKAAAGVWRSTLDADLQAQVNAILARRRRAWEGAGIANAAVLVLSTPTGRALVYCGNVDADADDTASAPADEGRQVDIITAPRSTGSLLKPFLYAAMLEAGEILPGTLVPDVPTHIAGYSPENFDRAYEGAVPARLALARSLNVPAVRMLRDYGVDRFLHTLRSVGLATATRSADDYGLTLVLGGAEGTLWDLTGMYAGLGREAQRFARPGADNETRPTFFPPSVIEAKGEARAQAAASQRNPPAGTAPATRALIGPASAWLALQAMAEVSRPDAEQYWRSFASSRWVAWKTGTSFGFRDAWAVGVTPEFTVGVWVGNASGQGRPGMTGIQVAAPVLFETFNLLPPTTGFEKPMASLVRIPVCPQSGMRVSPYCPPGDSAWVPTAGLRTAACPYHRLAHLDPTGRFQVHDGCEKVAAMRHQAWFVLPPAEEWYYRRRHGDYLPLPDWRRDCAEGALGLGAAHAMDLLYPRADAGIYVPIDLDARKGRTVFEAIHRDPAATVFWHLDQEYLGQTREFHKMAVDPAPGRHVLLLVDNRGERLEQTFEVLSRDADALGKAAPAGSRP